MNTLLSFAERHLMVSISNSCTDLLEHLKLNGTSSTEVSRVREVLNNTISTCTAALSSRPLYVIKSMNGKELAIADSDADAKFKINSLRHLSLSASGILVGKYHPVLADYETRPFMFCSSCKDYYAGNIDESTCTCNYWC